MSSPAVYGNRDQTNKQEPWTENDEFNHSNATDQNRQRNQCLGGEHTLPAVGCEEPSPVYETAQIWTEAALQVGQVSFPPKGQSHSNAVHMQDVSS